MFTPQIQNVTFGAQTWVAFHMVHPSVSTSSKLQVCPLIQPPVTRWKTQGAQVPSACAAAKAAWSGTGMGGSELAAAWSACADAGTATWHRVRIKSKPNNQTEQHNTTMNSQRETSANQSTTKKTNHSNLSKLLLFIFLFWRWVITEWKEASAIECPASHLGKLSHFVHGKTFGNQTLLENTPIFKWCSR